MAGSRLGHPLLIMEEVDSTNSEVIRRARAGAEGGLVVIAKRQSQGRGRMGRRWHTLEGSLAMSVLLRPSLPPQRMPLINLTMAVAAHAALSRFASDLAIKWPNDILRRGKKLAGILTEMHSDRRQGLFVVIGIGVNIHPPSKGWPEEVLNATSLVDDENGAPSPMAVAHALLEEMEAAYALFEKEGFAPFRPRWWQAHAAKHRRVFVSDRGKKVAGKAVGLDRDGSLILDVDGRLRRVQIGDVEIAA